MRPLELLVVYLMIGAGVALAWSRSGKEGAAWAVGLWPLFVPALLVREAPPSPPPVLRTGGWGDRIAAAIGALEAALGAWDALPERSVCEQSLRAASRGLGALAERHAQLDGVLSTPENSLERLAVELEAAPVGARPLVEARLGNVQHLHRLREEAREELERALAGLADLSTRVHLARFTGHDAREVAAQLARLAAAVDGASEVAKLGDRSVDRAV
ncbi:MAG: hypothetical protein H6739_08405 [Alphaproteobacteria bacterium]|nr:hypothetical protein [Alphaproteobacteria bacterium]